MADTKKIIDNFKAMFDAMTPEEQLSYLEDVGFEWSSDDQIEHAWDWSGYRCKTTGLTCCGCALFCEHREEKRDV